MSKHALDLERLFTHTFRLTLASLALVGSAHAQSPGSHPALPGPRLTPGIDVSTFIVGHPARGSAGRAQRDGRHPALLTSAGVGRPALDPNAFLVQPPATTRWTSAPAVLLAQPATR